MARLNKSDLAQMGETYFKSLEQERLVEVAKNLYELAVEQLEKLEQTSQNSSRPPSSDSPYQSVKKKVEETIPEKNGGTVKEAPTSNSEEPSESPSKGFGKRKAGRQPGAKGHWRSQMLKAEQIISHYPESCVACDARLEMDSWDNKPHMGYYQLELQKQDNGFTIVCQMHHFYAATCSCGHHSHMNPGKGELSLIDGRSIQLRLQENILVGPMLASFIASLAVRYRLSRTKIQEFLQDWSGIALSTSSIDRCIREAGLACRPVVEELIGQLQEAQILHLDETPWYEAGQLCWLWVAVNSTCAVFFIGARTKEMLLTIISTTFVGWLISDGYKAYRWYENRQRCLAHLIRKALALSEVVDTEARQFAQWLLEEMRELIHGLAQTGIDDPDDPGTIRLKKIALLSTVSEHPKLRALAREILNDWDAVVAFVTNPQLPVTNNLAERALRHAVIARSIGFGTRTSEGSKSYAALLSVIETCRLRLIDTWVFLAQTISLRRKGLDAPLIPYPLTQVAL
jgi:transposase